MRRMILLLFFAGVAIFTEGFPLSFFAGHIKALKQNKNDCFEHKPPIILSTGVELLIPLYVHLI